jgi:ElaB/YqjD/DUF883 family membrane-anchored ribosome-binding protein
MANTTTSSRGNEARGNAGQAFDKARDAAGNVVDKAREAAAQVGEKAKEAAGSVGEMVGQTATAVGRKADDLTSSAGTSIKNFGDTIREHAPQSGVLGEASKTVANTTKQVGQYLEQEGLSGMVEDLTNLIKRNPVPAILVGVGLGVLIGRVMRS